MEIQIVHLMECFIAYVAFVCFVFAVGELMIFVVPLLMESFTTKFTNVRLISGVYSGVGIQRGRSVKCFIADVAFVGFVGRMNYFVATQSRCLAKSLSTYFADKWSGSY